MILAIDAVEWLKAVAPLGAAVIQLVAAVAVAYFGFRYGLRKTREERGFDRRVSWYEEAITALSSFQEALLRAAITEQSRAELDERDGLWAARGANVLRESHAEWDGVQERANYSAP